MSHEDYRQATGPIVDYNGPGDIEHVDARPIEEAPVMNDNDMKLGTFSTNNSKGCCMSRAETSFKPSPAHTIELAKKADDLGFEAIVPVARWKGFGGDSDFNGQTLEPYIWGATIAQYTSYSNIFITSHVPAYHPLLAAKQSTTVDHVSNGRMALNIVAGWFTPEINMFGTPQLEHDVRYDRTHEWAEVLKKFWTEQGFTYDGDHYQIQREDGADEMEGFTSGGYMRPKPIQQPRPPVMNAGFSEAGQNFAATHADVIFVSATDPDNAAELVDSVKGLAADKGRDPDQIQIFTGGFVCIGDTDEQAQEKYDSIVENGGDWEGAYNLMNILGIESDAFDAHIDDMAERFIAGYSNYPMVGTPETITDEFVELSEAGIDGMVFSFLDYREGLERFGEEVMPLMEAEGLREEKPEPWDGNEHHRPPQM
jgi:FMNH2-dependent dimethyl sulfone monooxygenase